MDNSYDYATIIDTPLRCSVLNNVYNKLYQHILGYFVSINDTCNVTTTNTAWSVFGFRRISKRESESSEIDSKVPVIK